MLMKDDIRHVRIEADYRDEGTRQSIQQFTLPCLRRRAEDLERERRGCEVRADWLDNWSSMGLVTAEAELRQAIAYAERQLAKYPTPELKRAGDRGHGWRSHQGLAQPVESLAARLGLI